MASRERRRLTLFSQLPPKNAFFLGQKHPESRLGSGSGRPNRL
jgi:hypothetical protein